MPTDDIKSICETCKGPTTQNVLFEKSVLDNDHDSGWWDERIYQVIQCAGCQSISYRTLYDDVQSANIPDNPYSQTLYPKRTINSPIKSFPHTPENIVMIYEQTINAYLNDLQILCSAGLRTIIEGICKDKGVTEGIVVNKFGVEKKSEQLDGKIEGLAAKGFLTKAHATYLHELRFLGNDALHTLSPPSDKELKFAINIIEHSIENIYELSHQARRLKAEATRRKNKKADED